MRSDHLPTCLSMSFGGCSHGFATCMLINSDSISSLESPPPPNPPNPLRSTGLSLYSEKHVRTCITTKSLEEKPRREFAMAPCLARPVNKPDRARGLVVGTTPAGCRLRGRQPRSDSLGPAPVPGAGPPLSRGASSGRPSLCFRSRDRPTHPLLSPQPTRKDFEAWYVLPYMHACAARV